MHLGSAPYPRSYSHNNQKLHQDIKISADVCVLCVIWCITHMHTHVPYIHANTHSMFITTGRETIITMFTKYLRISLIQVQISIYQVSKDINLIEKHIRLCMTLYRCIYIVYSIPACCIVCTCIKWAYFSVYKKIKNT